MKSEYLDDLTGIKDSRGRKVFNYSQAGRTFEIHAHTDWNRLFGECDTDMEQMLRDIDPKSEESDDEW